MYRKPEIQLRIEEFVLPLGGKLNPENRWVKLSQIIPWEEIEKKYAQLFLSNTGTVAKPLRVALGALIIKEKCGFSDRETVKQIRENPYLQFFIGYERYQDDKVPFDPSLMVHFRKRLDKTTMMDINEMICLFEKQPIDDAQAKTENNTTNPTTSNDPKDPQDPGEPPVFGGNQNNNSESPEPTKLKNKGKFVRCHLCSSGYPFSN